jgi:HEPN superfamily RiboL-PSP-like protein
MKAALDQFQANLVRARTLSGVAESIGALTTPAIDVTDIHRASLVLGVSALDYFVHEFVRLGMLEVHRGKRPATEASLSFKIPIIAVRTGFADLTKDDWLDEAVRETHSWQSFQHPDKIADAIRLVTAVKLWQQVATEIGSDAPAVKARLIVIVDRRNKIAHEADMDPTNPGNQWPISAALVKDALDFIDRVVQAIYKLAV